MKKYLFAALAAFALLAISCNDNEEGSIDDSMLVGTTWYMVGEPYHPIIATFEKNGKYTWEYGGITGFKDTGTYTVKGNVLTLNIESFWEIETDWIDGVPGHAVGSEWQKVDNQYTAERAKTRIVRIYVQEPRFTIWGVENDWFMGAAENAEMVVFMSDDLNEIHANKTVSQADLQGEWEGRNSSGELTARLIIDGNKYTAYSLNDNYYYNTETQETIITKYVSKDTGTFKLEGSTFTITVEKQYESMVYDSKTDSYSYSNYDPSTLEATEWLSESNWEYTSAFYVYRDGTNLFYGMSMHGVALKKK